MSEPAPSEKPEPSPFEKLRDFTRQVLSVPKAEIDRREAEYQEERTKKKRERAGQSFTDPSSEV